MAVVAEIRAQGQPGDVVLSRGAAHGHELETKRQAAPLQAAAARRSACSGDRRGRHAEQAQQRETVEQLYRAIRQLPKADAALVLLYLDELSYREMAEVLGISESNVGVKLNRQKNRSRADAGRFIWPLTFSSRHGSQSSRTQVVVDTDLLLKEVKRNQRNFLAAIFWRDFREVGSAIVILPVWLYLGIKMSLPWTWYLIEPATIWVIVFRLVDQMRHRRKPTDSDNPLLEGVQDSLAQVEHQIWLLRNIFWWYLLPFALPMVAFFAHVALLTSSSWLQAVGTTIFFSMLVIPVNAAVYYLNRRSVRVELEPRRRELLALLASLGDESTDEHVAVSREQRPKAPDGCGAGSSAWPCAARRSW